MATFRATFSAFVDGVPPAGDTDTFLVSWSGVLGKREVRSITLPPLSDTAVAIPTAFTPQLVVVIPAVTNAGSWSLKNVGGDPITNLFLANTPAVLAKSIAFVMYNPTAVAMTTDLIFMG